MTQVDAPGVPAMIGRAEPRVGIGMPVYNGEGHIRQAIESHLCQTMGDFELVVADNQSSDGTEAICREFVAVDPRVRYVRNEANLGGPGNFRQVFALCRGKYHKWSTADDWWDPTFLEKAVAILDGDRETVLCYPRTILVDEAGNATGRYDDFLHLRDEHPSVRFSQLYQTIGLCQAHLGLIRREAMASTALIGSELASDIRFLAELTLYGRFFVIPEYLFHRRFHDGSSSWDRTDMNRQEAYYAPAQRGGFRFHLWRRYLSLLRAAARAPIASREKWAVAAYLGRRMRWQRWGLVRELVALGKPDPRGLYLR